MRVCARPRGTANWRSGRVSGLLRGFLVARDGLGWAAGARCEFQTAGGPGEPKGNGAANRFPFPLPVRIVANRKRKYKPFFH
jgi:hypothetical protein